MYEHLTTQEVGAAIDELARGLGVKEDIQLVIPSVLSTQDIPAWVQKVARSLGLPVQVNVTFVSSKSREAGFGTTAISKTDQWGRGIDGITAQVSIPESLPTLGTSRMKDFPIEVRVTDNAGQSPATFVAVMAHELSHVLLASLRHPQRESELHTDLCPLILGFRRIVALGRTRVEYREQGTITTTYGYLTDDQFSFALGHIEELLDDAHAKIDRATELMQGLRSALPKASKEVARFEAYRAYMNRHPPKSTKQADAERLVLFNSVNYTREWKLSIERARKELQDLRGEIAPVTHYTEQVLQRLDRQQSRLSVSATTVSDALGSVTTDVRTLRRYLPLLVKLRESRWLGWLLGGRMHLDEFLIGHSRPQTRTKSVAERGEDSDVR